MLIGFAIYPGSNKCVSALGDVNFWVAAKEEMSSPCSCR